MRLVALLSFYDEPVASLKRYVRGARDLGCDAVCAVDGAYVDFPDGRAASPPEQHAALVDACAARGLALHLHVPATTWQGNEVQKRSAMHWLAGQVWHAVHLGPGGPEPTWHVVIDADEVPDHVPGSLLERLGASDRDVAELTLREAGGDESLRRRLYKALAGVTLRGNHYTYVAADGRVLCAGADRHQEPALDVSDLVIAHKPSRVRSEARNRAKHAYYERKVETGAEDVACEGCGGRATQLVRTGWRRMEGRLMSDPMDACQWCAERERAVSRDALRAMGANPDRVRL